MTSQAFPRKGGNSGGSYLVEVRRGGTGAYKSALGLTLGAFRYCGDQLGESPLRSNRNGSKQNSISLNELCCSLSSLVR